MDFSLNEEQRAWQEKARKFAEEEIRPRSLARDRIKKPLETYDWDLIKAGSKLGFRTLAVPKSWGGPGADFVTQTAVMMELARADSAVCKAFSQNWKWSHVMATSCSDDQKERFFKPFLEDHGYLLGRGLTEPNAGSDNRLPPPENPKAGFRLKAERQGDEWILNGEKCFIANGSVGSLFFVDARTNPEVNVKMGGSLFMVPKTTPGLRVGKVFDKRGWRFYQNAELIFENARVPHANVVGEINSGSKAGAGDTTGGDIFGDIELAANATGVCDDAIALATAYAKSTKRAGKPLYDSQLVRLKLVEMHSITEALRSYVFRVAWERDAGGPISPHASLAMNYSTTVIQRVTRLNMEIHGAEGRLMNARVDKLVRDAMIWTHLAGDNVQRLRSLNKIK